MRILIHSNAPWVPTGYGCQTRLLMEQLRQRGHTVGVSAYAGLGGGDIRWRGHQIMPSGQMAFGVDVLPAHAHRFAADLVIALMDLRMLEGLGESLRSLHLAAWLPVDCAPVSRLDMNVLAMGGVLPIAMSQFGQTQLAAELGGTGNVSYAPHAVDTVKYAPMDDRAIYRRELGVDDLFVVGICAANKDGIRKAFPEQFKAFAQFHQKHQDSVLLVHSTMRNVSGLNLMELANDMDIVGAIRFTDQYVLDSGLMNTEMMRRWYSALDVLSLCSWAEGFGVPLIEAQACGTPVVTTDGSAMTELVGPGWLVDADDVWNPLHRASWRRPHVASIAKAYTAAYNAGVNTRRERAREFALRYDVNTVFETYWEPILKEL